MQEILEKAKELGMMLAESGEFEKLKIAEERQFADPDAQKLMMEYANKREELAKKASAPETTKEEFESIKMHPVIGAEIFGKSKKLSELSDIVLMHHQRYDGVTEKHMISHTVMRRSRNLGKMYDEIYREGRLTYEIETFCENGDCEILYYR